MKTVTEKQMRRVQNDIPKLQKKLSAVMKQITPLKVTVRKFFQQNKDVIQKLLDDLKAGQVPYHQYNNIAWAMDKIKRGYFGTDVKLAGLQAILTELQQHNLVATWGSVETVEVPIRKADKKLAALIESGCDGGNGEFEKYLPKQLRKQVDERDATFVPRLLKKRGMVIWVEVTNTTPPNVTQMLNKIIETYKTVGVGTTSATGNVGIQAMLSSYWGERADWVVKKDGIYSADADMQYSWEDEIAFIKSQCSAQIKKLYELANSCN